MYLDGSAESSILERMKVKSPQLVYSSVPDGQVPLLSIVTLCYNTGRFIVEGMEANLAHLQSDNVEHVILDDGSTDDSVKRMTDYAISTGYPVRIYANPKNLGITESKSRILKLAMGEFIAECADDIFLPERIEHDLNMIQSLPEEVAGFYSLVLPFSVSGEGHRHHHKHPLGELNAVRESTVLSACELLHRLRKGNFIPAMGVCLRKTVYDAFPQDTTYFIEDYPMWAKMAQAGWGLGYSPVVTTLYRRAEHSVQRSSPLKVDFDALRVQLEILGIRPHDFSRTMKERWFRVICKADDETISRLQEVCARSSHSGGILFLLAKMKLSHRLRWILSNLSLKLNFWRYL